MPQRGSPLTWPVAGQNSDSRDPLLLRAGRGTALFLLPGGGGDLRELDPLIAKLQTRRPLVGVPYWIPAENGAVPTTVAAMTERALQTITQRQPEGPYQLVGYSLGGLVAVEVARQLSGRGQVVRPPILIDALPHQLSWPWPILLLAGVRHKIHRALTRRESHGLDSAQSATAADLEFEAINQRSRAARKSHRPARYGGRIRLLHASAEPSVGGLAPGIWRRLALEVESIPFSAQHLDLLRRDTVVAQLARTIDQFLETDAAKENQRRALLITGVNWDRTVRLARELDRVGFRVDAIAPPGHPIASLSSLGSFHELKPLRTRRSVEAAIRRSEPDILIPVDDFVTDLLHRLHVSSADAGLKSLIERSLGDARYYGKIFDRRWMIELAASEGVPVPRTVCLESRKDLQRQLQNTGLPAFLKVDGSWGGLGVARIEQLADANTAWSRIARKLGPLRAIKRALVNGDLSGLDRALGRRRSTFSLQEAKRGQLAIVSAVCRNGELLGMVSARVLSCQEAFGAATVIQMDNQLPLREPVIRIVRRLGLSGFCGFDFILSDTSDDAYFIELNPRATQTSDFVGESDGDILESFLRSLGGLGEARDNLLPDGTHVTIADVARNSQGTEIPAPARRADSPAEHTGNQ